MIGIIFAEEHLYIKEIGEGIDLDLELPLNLKIKSNLKLELYRYKQKKKSSEILFPHFGDSIRKITNRNFIEWCLINLFSKCFNKYKNRKDKAFLIIPSGYSLELIDLIKKCLFIYGIDVFYILDLNLTLAHFLISEAKISSDGEGFILFRRKGNSLYSSLFKTVNNNQIINLEFKDSRLKPLFFDKYKWVTHQNNLWQILSEEIDFYSEKVKTVLLWFPQSISKRFKIALKNINSDLLIIEGYDLKGLLDYNLGLFYRKEFFSNSFRQKKALSFGIQVKEDEFLPIITKEDNIPVVRKRLFRLKKGLKYEVDVNLMAGFSPNNDDNFIILSIPLTSINQSRDTTFIVSAKLNTFNSGTFSVSIPEYEENYEKDFKILY